MLARKITRSKWEQRAGLPADSIPADAVTGDLRTSENSLSFWACDSEDPRSIEQTVLALAAGSDHVNKLDLAWIPETEVRENDLVLKETPGNTPVTSLQSRHRDIACLDYTRLGRVARLIETALTSNGFRRFRRAEVLNILVTAVRHGSVHLEDLKDNVRAEVAKRIG